ncbi:hypothetical protein F444_01553 [Phytophthora nicotianae P1976]|uniref:Copia protein n=1 Tax=Phytophthora nicotianae P1976 TaxID=1317066 RepID=A0A081B095_PHYNI|nr:hypothetical protein F444_01553 [Phytophthora nicotianae P1976]
MIGIDNQAAYVMATNPTYSRRTRHIELRWHFVREQASRMQSSRRSGVKVEAIFEEEVLEYMYKVQASSP